MNSAYSEHILYARACIQEIEHAYKNNEKIGGKQLRIFSIVVGEPIRYTNGIALHIIYEDKSYTPYLIQDFDTLLHRAKRKLEMDD